MIFWTCALVSVLQIVSLGLAQECPLCDCNIVDATRNCSEEVELGPCSCCQRCNKELGESCGGVDGRCGVGLFCLPDNPYAGEQGTCYGDIGCLTFGCEQESEQCSCLYSTVCPTKAFPFFTIEDCEQDLLRQRCEDSNCSLAVDQLNCPTGSLFIPGEDECCPFSGTCLCNSSLCEEPQTGCPKWTEPVFALAANESEGRCCDEYTCEKIPGCVYSGSHYELGEEWLLSVCEKCMCTEEGEQCSLLECEHLDCIFTYVQEGECCPVCADNPSPTPNVETNKCQTLDGRQYNHGEKWSEDPCTDCACNSGETQCLTTHCFPLVCMNESSYYVPDGMCCPMCSDEPTQVYTQPMGPMGPMGPTQSTEMPVSTLPPEHPSNQSVPIEEPMTFQTQLPTSPSHPSMMEIVLVVNRPYSDVLSKLSDFTTHLSLALNEYSVKVDAITLIPHNSSQHNTILAVVLVNEGNTMITESEITLTVTQTAEEMDLIPGPMAESSEKQNDASTTIVVAVLAFVTCVSLVCLVGAVLAVLWLMRTRRARGLVLRGSSKRPRSMS